MTDNMRIWDALARTDPAHTKGFNRAGGFKGTAVKPIWIIKRLTEQFGPAGEGWGVNEPSFQTVQCDGEILVYCTVSTWHGEPSNLLWGVGGDKVQAKRQSGVFCDDEAFKKAFTDAINNAFKSIGVAADVHMGLFDDDKYVADARREFAGQDAPALIDDAQWAELAQLVEATKGDTIAMCEHYKVKSLRELTVTQFEHARDTLRRRLPDPNRKAA